MTAPDVTAVLALSNERDQWMRRIHNNWRAGYAAGEAAHRDDYDCGWHDGILARKHAQHDLVEAARLYAARWELRGEARTRETFGQPHPGDHEAGSLPLEMPGIVSLGGPPVHRHDCTSACYAYRPGYYSADVAAAILETLPGHGGEAR